MAIRTLICDDMPSLRALFTALLEDDPDLEVVGEAGDGRECLERVAAIRPDLVLLDLRMPVQDGYQTVPLLKERFPAMRVIVLSCEPRSAAAARVAELGADGFVQKDLPWPQALAGIKELLAGERFAPGRVSTRPAR